MLHPEALAQTLPIFAKGMAGIFLVIGIIVLVMMFSALSH